MNNKSWWINVDYGCEYDSKRGLYSAAHSRVDFSGVSDDLQLPVFYFIIHFFDATGQPLTESPEKMPVLSLRGEHGKPIRSHKEILDRFDGTAIGRYRLWVRQGLRTQFIY